MITIKKNNNEFTLESINRGLEIRIYCAQKIQNYHENRNNVINNSAKTDQMLYQLFHSATNVTEMTFAITSLFQRYGLQRSNPVKGFESNVAQCLLNIDSNNENRLCGLDTIEGICDDFYHTQDVLTNSMNRSSDFPDVSLSKLLHFYRPNSFWIIDKRVLNIASLMGYETDYHGFASLLHDLFSNPYYNEFEQSARRVNSNYVLDNDNSFPILKIIDKILF